MVEDGTSNGHERSPFLDGIETDELRDERRLELTPEQHERLKNGLHGEVFERLRRAGRRYLVIGRGRGKAGQRRVTVCECLDERVDASAFRLEDFGFTDDEVALWAPAFDVLSAMATHVVGVLEDFNGGHVWELGLLYHEQRHVRDILWLLKRVYEDEATMREHYDNGMAASHLAALQDAAEGRVVTWRDPADLPDAVESIP